MAECCRERHITMLVRGGVRLRRIARECVAANRASVSAWLAHARREAGYRINPPDERLAWTELVRELEGLTQ